MRAFVDACAHGHLEAVTANVASGNVDVHAPCDGVFWSGNAHLIGHVRVVSDVAFGCACSGGHLVVAKCLYDTIDGLKVNGVAVQKAAFRFACKHGQLPVARWLHEQMRQGDDHSIYNGAFWDACTRGHLALAKWLHGGIDDVDVHIHHDVPFRSACGHGQLAVAKWLHEEVHGVNVHALDDDAFSIACARGHVSVAKWLHNVVGGVSLPGRTCGFRWACDDGHLAVAKWLHEEVSGIDVHADDNHAVRVACSRQHADIALWLDSVGTWSLTNRRPAECTQYLQALRWSDLRRQWIGTIVRSASASLK